MCQELPIKKYIHGLLLLDITVQIGSIKLLKVTSTNVNWQSCPPPTKKKATKTFREYSDYVRVWLYDWSKRHLIYFEKSKLNEMRVNISGKLIHLLKMLTN